MTRLYLDDTYRSEFDAEIVESAGGACVLSRTAFHPGMPDMRASVALRRYGVTITCDLAHRASRARRAIARRAGRQRHTVVENCAVRIAGISDDRAPRDSMVIVAAFGAVALLLALFGIYGVVAYGVVQRGHEIAVRMVLGARRPAVLRLVLRRFTGLTTAGMLVGLVGAMGLTRYLDGLLFDVTSLDAMTFVAVPSIFIMVATVAALVPARRAATLDPRSILRTD